MSHIDPRGREAMLPTGDLGQTDRLTDRRMDGQTDHPPAERGPNNELKQYV